MKLSTFAVAASLVASPVAAQDKCDVATYDNPWNGFVVHMKADTLKGQFCMSFTTDNKAVAGIVIKKDDGAGITTYEIENCLDIKGAANQMLTPMVLATSGNVIGLPPLDVDEATKAFINVLAKCFEEAQKPDGVQARSSAMDKTLG